MNPILAKTVVLSMVTLLALPQGWCCSVPMDEVVEAAPAKTKCCQPPTPESPTDRLPTTPDVECCCSHDEAIPAKAIELPDTPTVALFTVPDLGDLDLGSVRDCDSEAFLLDPGPKLHILKCVWRC